MWITIMDKYNDNIFTDKYCSSTLLNQTDDGHIQISLMIILLIFEGFNARNKYLIRSQSIMWDVNIVFALYTWAPSQYKDRLS